MPKSAMSFRLTGKWKRMTYLLDANRLGKQGHALLSQATRRNGIMVKAKIRERIARGDYPPQNVPLTVALKGSGKPLVDNAELWKAITEQVVDPFTVFVGVLRTAKGKNGEDLVNIAVVLHEGATIPVTGQMRTMFFYLWLATTGRIDAGQLEGRAAELFERVKEGTIIRRLSPQTQAIIVPRRPFIEAVFEDSTTLAAVRKIWTDAWGRAIRGKR